MNWDSIKLHWTQVCEQIKVTWGKLGDEDLVAIAGQRDRLSSLLRERYGYAKLQAETKVDNFAEGLGAMSSGKL